MLLLISNGSSYELENDFIIFFLRLLFDGATKYIMSSWYVELQSVDITIINNNNEQPFS